MESELVLSLVLFELGLLIYIERRLTRLEAKVETLVKFIKSRNSNDNDDSV